MASRINRKNAAIASPKEVVNAEKSIIIKNEPGVGQVTSKPTAKPAIGKRIAKKNQTKRVNNKTSVAVKLKAKAKKYPLAKTLLQNTKTVDGRKRLLKNVVKEGKPRKRKIKEELDDSPPVLEPIFPIEENVETKKQPRTRATKKTVDPIDVNRIKVENEDDLSLSSDVTDISNSEIPTLTKQVRKPRVLKKPKVEIETLEDVMNDLSYLIKTEEVKEEGESLSESSKTETMSKPKKLTKRQRIELLKKKIIKKENIENTLSKLDSADEKVIDMLDLNVKRVKQKPLTKRRHSIEKFPVGTSDDSECTQLPFLGNFPRSISPKTRKIVKPRQSIDGASKRSSPYSTRSESPARILRNGKQRKAKGHLLEGLETEIKKRRRLCSDLSGSEMSMSKLSGYDSDSSFSDLSSVHGAEINEPESSKTKEESIRPTASSETPITASKGPIDNFGIIDTNFNLCSDLNLSNKKMIAENQTFDDPTLPDKDTLLDIMKLAFNDVNHKKSPKTNQKIDALLTSKFYGKPARSKAADKPETVVQEDVAKTHVGIPEIRSELTNPPVDIVEPEIVQNVPDTAIVQDPNTIVVDKNITSKIESNTNDTETSDTSLFEDFTKKDSVTEYDFRKFDESVIGVAKLITKYDEPNITNVSGTIENLSEAVTNAPIAVTNEPIAITTDHIAVTTEPIAVTTEPVVANNISEAADNQFEAVITAPEPSVVFNDIQDIPKIEIESQQELVGNIIEDSKENSIDLNLQSESFAEAVKLEEDINLQPDVKNYEDKLVDVNENKAQNKEILINSQIDHSSNISKEDNLNTIDMSETATEQLLVPEAVDNYVTEAVQDSMIETVEESLVEDLVNHAETAINQVSEAFNKTHDTVVSDEIDVKSISDVNMTDNCYTVMDNSEENGSVNVEESAEELAVKESILQALGLQSLRAAEEAKQKTTKEKPASWKSDSYTGTLKTVIKINRDKKKGGKGSIKMTLQKSKPKAVVAAEEEQNIEEDQRTNKDGTSSILKQGSHSSDTAGAHRKSHYSNRSNLDGSSEHTSDGESATQDGAIKALVIPEKASSFSIHPGRLCKDECSYCFGKFGLFDTPCHIAQMKSVDRQNKILATEKHLTRDSCLCDACYRHVDRKSNTPSYTNRSFKRNSLVAPGPRQNHCHVLGCNEVASNILRRKWIIKMRKSICQVINIDLDNPGLHSIPICEHHYAALEHLMVCAMCKRRLARNHVHYLGPEVDGLNAALEAEGVPLALNDRPVVCKLCKCFAAVALKEKAERPESSESFFREYKKRLLHFNHIVPMDTAAAEEPITVPCRADRMDAVKRKKKPYKSDSEGPSSRDSPEKVDEREASRPASRSESPSDDYNGVDYNTLIPAIAMDCGSDTESRSSKDPFVGLKKFGSQIEAIKDSVEITKISKHAKSKTSDTAVQKLGSNPSISVRQLFPGEEDVPLHAHVDFDNVKETTPEGWEKCSTTIQYDAETKRLWQELQKPYGNQSSFLRHLILLEKYFRNGDLILSPRASHHAINYSESVNNRLRAYDNIPSGVVNVQPMTMLPFNKMQKSSSGIITSAHVGNATTIAPPTAPSLPTHVSPPLCKPIGNLAMSVTTIPSHAYKGGASIPGPAFKGGAPNPGSAYQPPKSGTPITISQLNSPPLIPALRPKGPSTKGAATAPPPGLISLRPGTARPVAPLSGGVAKVPQSQKIKFPITKNWRPNLIPIDPSKKQEKKVGLVQVISGGKPYHITLEDYKKMCAIKRSFEMKQKRLQDAQNAQNAKPILVTHNSVLKSIIPRKGLIISKTAAVVKNEVTSPPPIPSGEENILEKLDRQVEKLESKLNEKAGSSLLLPRIPRSLTVIPQTVTRKSSSRPSSPVLMGTQKSNGSSS
ncbi:unnamed protein product [Phaedon cochleariae]|uniref:Uncharacterized protein n=1 Tax=Phaedon cochleariae TaxID=80249 RepID=A0A9N9SKF4_PHACE|nr:unnamed protein product [Phaedon cochleariae]